MKTLIWAQSNHLKADVYQPMSQPILFFFVSKIRCDQSSLPASSPRLLKNHPDSR